MVSWLSVALFSNIILCVQVSSASDLKKLLACIPSTVSLSRPDPDPSFPAFQTVFPFILTSLAPFTVNAPDVAPPPYILVTPLFWFEYPIYIPSA